MDWKKLAQELKKRIQGQVIPQALMKNHTTWRVGGPADLLVVPYTEGDILNVLQFAGDHGLPITVIGNGSNLLVGDRGIRGITLKIAGGLCSFQIKGEVVHAEAGILLPKLARLALDAGLSGLEFAPGIPASLGGALVMNAGAFGQQLGDIVEEVVALDYQGNYQVFDASMLSFAYRASDFQNGKQLIVLKATLRLKSKDKQKILAQMERNLNLRKRTQPLSFPTAGSVFRNPPGDYAGRLIEEAGLKGFAIGDAQVSEKHANFIVNRGNASAAQILDLIRFIQEKVQKEFGVTLVPEVHLVGEGVA
ncbi:MAG: UDP-N-acetylenolpyruvoylglucosamine reductase [Thermoanaerobacterales bacterium 50_218]|nr:MAG: UDP-N-acetylenolpyruvoylglucosamine reductase [Thermoanaerobacterales bacterium 50_218]HAA90412.1 UDP-N-acetylenolpyruvoylglucosamine reductase [Peptococcaceae bacterium]